MSSGLPVDSFPASCRNIFNIVDIDIKDKKILVYASDSLSYVQPEHLSIFFDSLAKIKNVKIVAIHSAHENSKLIPGELKTSFYSLDFLYTHDYRWYAEESGIKTVKCEIIRPYYPYEDFPTHKNTVHYSYSGKTT